MSYDEELDARWEYQEQEYQDALQAAREDYEDFLEQMEYTEADYSFDEFLKYYDKSRSDIDYYGYIG